MNLIILGPQGSGKGTQAKLIAEKYGLTHLSSGELLRIEAESGSKKGKIIAKLLETGELLPFETVLDVLEPEGMEDDAGGFEKTALLLLLLPLLLAVVHAHWPLFARLVPAVPSVCGSRLGGTGRPRMVAVYPVTRASSTTSRR